MVTYKIYEVNSKFEEMMNNNKTFHLLVVGAIIWGIFGFIMTIGSFTYQYQPNLSSDELRQQIDTFDERILVNSIIIFAFVGMMFMIVLSVFYRKSPPYAATRNSFIFAIIMGIAYSLLSALWYFPNQDITGTNAILRPTYSRIFFNSLIGILAAAGSCTFFMQIQFKGKVRNCEACGSTMEYIEQGRGGLTISRDEINAGYGAAEECQECGRIYCQKCYPSRQMNTCVCCKGRDSVKIENGVRYHGSIRLVKVFYLEK